MSAPNKKTGRLDTTLAGQVHEAFAPTLRELRLGEHHLREIHRRAKAGDPTAQRELALAYCRGTGVRRDGPYAVKWMILASDAGDAEARRHLNYFLKGFPVDEIAEGRRLVARHRGEPVPTFGLRAEDTFHVDADADADDEDALRESETQLLARDLGEPAAVSAPRAAAPSSPRLARDVTGKMHRRGWSNPLAACSASMSPPAEGEMPSQRNAGADSPNWAAWAVGFSCVAIVAIIGGLAWMSLRAVPPDRAALSGSASGPESILAVAPAGDTGGIVASSDVSSAVSAPAAPLEDLSPLSRQLPASLRQVSPALLARWQDMDGLREKAGLADHDAEFDLAQWHLLKAESPDDFAESVRLLRRAAEGGVVQAQNNLGFCLVTGTGTALDMAEGYKWFAIATARGLRGAQANRDRAAQLLPPDKRDEVTREVEAFLAREHVLPRAARPPQAQPAADTRISGGLFGTLN